MQTPTSARGKDAVFTELHLDPAVAGTEHPVHVRWSVGVDVAWTPCANDEVRVYNTQGVLHGCLAMWKCTPHGEDGGYGRGEGTVVAPAAEGAYVVCLYDFECKKRVFSRTFRVTGSKVGLPRDIDVKQVEVAPAGRVDVCFDPKTLYGGFIALFTVSQPDNGGQNASNESPFGCALITLRAPTAPLLEGFDTTSLAFVAPTTVGEYQVRFLRPCKTDILRSVALSSTFIVRGCGTDESVASQTVKGTLSLPGAPAAGVKVGDYITVEWDVVEGCAVLSELDCVFLYPYGRPEAVRQTDEITAVAIAPLAKWRLDLQAPHDAGRYEVGYYSHRLQKFVLDGPSLLVVGEHAEFTVGVDTIVSALGSPVQIHWALDTLVYRAEDRCLVFDVTMSLVGAVPVTGCTGFVPPDEADPRARAHDVLFSKRKKGTLGLVFDRPGKYIGVYYSSLLQRQIAKTEPFRVVCGDAPGAAAYYSKSLEVTMVVRARQAPTKEVCLSYTVTGVDLSADPTALGRDRIGIFEASAPDCVPSHEFCSALESKALRTYWVDRRASEMVIFEPITTPGDYHVRYLTPTSLGGCCTILYYPFTVVAPGEEEQGGWIREPFDQIPVSELSLPVATLSADDGEGVLTPPGAERPTRGGGGGGGGAKTAVAKSLTTPGHRGAQHSSVILHFDPHTEFKGSVMVPRGVPIGEPVIVTYHVLNGTPLASDRLVIVDEACTEVHAETSLGEGSMGRENLTLGTVLLKSPRVQGLYMAGYYSAALRSLVMTALFRVLRPAAALAGSKHDADAQARGPTPPHGSDTPGCARSLSRPARFRAVLVGAPCQGAFHALRGTANDVALLKECLLESLPFATEEGIMTLCEPCGREDPTRQPTAYNIRRAIRWLLDDVRPKDHVLFYFTGLGSRVNSYSYSELDGYDCCLLPTDYDWRDRVITFEELRTSLYLEAPRGTNVTVILDCCFQAPTLDVAVQRGVFHEDEVSGTAVHCGAQRLKELRAKKGWEDRVVSRCLVPPQGTFHGYYMPGRRDECNGQAWDTELGGLSCLLRQMGSSADYKVRTDAMEAEAGAVVRPGQWLLQACTPSSHAYEKFIEGKYHGLFTWALVKGIQRQLKSTTPSNPLWYISVVQETQRVLGEWKYGQVPRLCVSDPDDVWRSLCAPET